jgi:hypothetical protein
VIAVLAVSLAIAVIACVWLGARGAQAARQRDEALAASAAAQERVTALEAAAATTTAELTSARSEVEATTSRLQEAEAAREAADADATLRRDLADDAESRATDAEARAADAETKAHDAEARAVEAIERAAALEAELSDLRATIDDLTSAEPDQPGHDDETGSSPETAVAPHWGGGPGPDTLWSLELARTHRTWRTSVSADPTADAFDDGGDPLRTAVEIDVAAIREEAGVEIELAWQLDAPLEPMAALAVLRAAQELLAATTRVADEARLLVGCDGADVVLTVTTPTGDVGRFTELTGVVEGRGIEPVDGGVRVVGVLVVAP